MTFDQHLLPERSSFQMGQLERAYRDRLYTALLPETDRSVTIAAALCLPSFESEWAIRIQRAPSNGTQMSLTEAETQIWSSEEQIENISVASKTIELDHAMVDEITQVWRRMLVNARPPKNKTLGCDGVEYQFFCIDGKSGHLSGQTWSPYPETAPGRLVTLLETLRELIIQEQPQAIRARIHEQLAWFADLPVRPRPPEEATRVLRTRIEKLMGPYEKNLISEREMVHALADALHWSRYPPLLEVLDIVELLPKHLLDKVREHLRD